MPCTLRMPSVERKRSATLRQGGQAAGVKATALRSCDTRVTPAAAQTSPAAGSRRTRTAVPLAVSELDAVRVGETDGLAPTVSDTLALDVAVGVSLALAEAVSDAEAVSLALAL